MVTKNEMGRVKEFASSDEPIWLLGSQFFYVLSFPVLFWNWALICHGLRFSSTLFFRYCLSPVLYIWGLTLQLALAWFGCQNASGVCRLLQKTSTYIYDAYTFWSARWSSQMKSRFLTSMSPPLSFSVKTSEYTSPCVGLNDVQHLATY